MSDLLNRLRIGSNNNLDLVELTLGDRLIRIPYQAAFEVSQSLRVGCKQSAAHDNAPATFWRDVENDNDDHPKPHRGFRRSQLAPNASAWEVRCNPPLVAIVFDGVSFEIHYEDGVRLSNMIRNAARRAKAWAGDASTISRLVGMVTDGNAA